MHSQQANGDSSAKMGTTCVPRQTHCSFLKCCRWRYFVYNRRLDPRLLAWQWRNGCHRVPFMMNIDGAKFEEHRFNTPRDMLDSVIYPFLERLMTSSAFLICILQKPKYLHNERRYFKKENAIRLYFEKP